MLTTSVQDSPDSAPTALGVGSTPPGQRVSRVSFPYGVWRLDAVLDHVSSGLTRKRVHCEGSMPLLTLALTTKTGTRAVENGVEPALMRWGQSDFDGLGRLCGHDMR